MTTRPETTQPETTQPEAQRAEAQRAGGRPRRRIIPVEVTEVRPLGDRFLSIWFAGDLGSFADAGPARHIKIALPEAGQHEIPLPEAGPEGQVWPADRPQPVRRTYTPRRYDAATGTLEVQFLRHGDGPASSWAERAAIGDKLGIAGPGGRPLPDGTGPWVIAGDESAIPAVGTLLDALPPGAAHAVYLEGTDTGISQDLAGGQPVHWVPADDRAPGAALHDALAGAVLPAEARVWVACESGAMRRIRHTLLDRGVSPDHLVSRGYWKSGEANHPDHDYGDDAELAGRRR